MKNRKGFTLVELLAVVVILALIMALGSKAVLQLVNKSKKDTLQAEGFSLIDAVEYANQMEQKPDSTLHLNLTDAHCYSINWLKENNYFDKSINSASGSVLVLYNTTGKYDYYYWLTNGEYHISAGTRDISIVEKGEGDLDEISTCGGVETENVNNASKYNVYAYCQNCSLNVNTQRVIEGGVTYFYATADPGYNLEYPNVEGNCYFSNGRLVASSVYEDTYCYLYASRGSSQNGSIYDPNAGQTSENPDNPSVVYDASLSNLYVTGYDFPYGFDPYETRYTILVPHEVTSVYINATAMDPSATITGIGYVELPTTITYNKIRVTLPSGTIKEYMIVITRDKIKSTDSTLKSISITKPSQTKYFEDTVYEFTPEITPGNYTYYANVSWTVGYVKLAVETNDRYAYSTVDSYQNLSTGENVIDIPVIAEDSSESHYYLIITKSAKPDRLPYPDPDDYDTIIYRNSGQRLDITMPINAWSGKKWAIIQKHLKPEEIEYISFYETEDMCEQRLEDLHFNSTRWSYVYFCQYVDYTWYGLGTSSYSTTSYMRSNHLKHYLKNNKLVKTDACLYYNSTELCLDTDFWDDNKTMQENRTVLYNLMYNTYNSYPSCNTYARGTYQYDYDTVYCYLGDYYFEIDSDHVVGSGVSSGNACHSQLDGYSWCF